MNICSLTSRNVILFGDGCRYCTTGSGKSSQLVLEPGPIIPAAASSVHTLVQADQGLASFWSSATIASAAGHKQEESHIMSRVSPATWSFYATRIIVVALLYLFSARIALLLAFEETNASPVWPASGFALSAVLLLGPTAWPGILAGAFVANVWVFGENLLGQRSLPEILLASLIIGLGNTAEALAGAALLDRTVGGHLAIVQKIEGSFKFMFLCPLAVLVSALVGALTLCLWGVATWHSFGTVFFTWWVGDFSGMFVITPAVISWAHCPPRRPRALECLELLAMLALLAALSMLIFGGLISSHHVISLPYLVMPLIIWAAFRFTRCGLPLAIMIVTAGALWGACRQVGPFHREIFNESLLQVQLFVSVLAMMGTLLAAAVLEAKEAAHALTAFNSTLEQRVAERTDALSASNAELLRSEEAAQAASLAKSAFVANMSHELRTPIHGILGMTDLTLEEEEDEGDDYADENTHAHAQGQAQGQGQVQQGQGQRQGRGQGRGHGRQGRLSAEQREQLQAVRQSAGHLLNIVDDVLDISKIEAGKLVLESAPFDVRELVAGAMRMLAVRAHVRGLALRWHIADDVPYCLQGDPGRLRQCLVNLVGNALKFTEEGSVTVQVLLSTSTAPPAPPPAGSLPPGREPPRPVDMCADATWHEKDSCCAAEGAGFPGHPERREKGSCTVLQFCVTDTGIGIPADKKDIIFASFEQADSSMTRIYGGTGLGLSITARLVTMMEGSIWLESTPGVGSTFSFTAAFHSQELDAADSHTSSTPSSAPSGDSAAEADRAPRLLSTFRHLSPSEALAPHAASPANPDGAAHATQHCSGASAMPAAPTTPTQAAGQVAFLNAEAETAAAMVGGSELASEGTLAPAAAQMPPAAWAAQLMLRPSMCGEYCFSMQVGGASLGAGMMRAALGGAVPSDLARLLRCRSLDVGGRQVALPVAVALDGIRKTRSLDLSGSPNKRRPRRSGRLRGHPAVRHLASWEEQSNSVSAAEDAVTSTGAGGKGCGDDDNRCQDQNGKGLGGQELAAAELAGVCETGLADSVVPSRLPGGPVPCSQQTGGSSRMEKQQLLRGKDDFVTGHSARLPGVGASSWADPVSASSENRAIGMVSLEHAQEVEGKEPARLDRCHPEMKEQSPPEKVTQEGKTGTPAAGSASAGGAVSAARRSGSRSAAVGFETEEERAESMHSGSSDGSSGNSRRGGNGSGDGSGSGHGGGSSSSKISRERARGATWGVAEGVGASAIASVTAHAGGTGAAAAAAAGQVWACGEEVHILLADDSPINRKVACRLLAKRGLNVDAVDDGAQVLERLQLRPGHYHLLLLDVQMPVLDGLATVRAIRQREATGGLPRFPVVGLTANSSPADRDRCLSAGMDEFVAKPFSVDHLIATMQAALQPTGLFLPPSAIA